jgi:hypothetical protein
MTTAADLADVVTGWADPDGSPLSRRERAAQLSTLLPHLDEREALSYVDEAAEHTRAADDIRDGVGVGDWRALVAEYIGEHVTGLEDAAEITAAEDGARVMAQCALIAAVAADRAALAESQQDEHAELIDALCAPEPVTLEGDGVWAEEYAAVQRECWSHGLLLGDEDLAAEVERRRGVPA